MRKHGLNKMMPSGNNKAHTRPGARQMRQINRLPRMNKREYFRPNEPRIKGNRSGNAHK